MAISFIKLVSEGTIHRWSAGFRAVYCGGDVRIDEVHGCGVITCFCNICNTGEYRVLYPSIKPWLRILSRRRIARACMQEDVVPSSYPMGTGGIFPRG
jgi:hypothetical protein